MEFCLFCSCLLFGGALASAATLTVGPGGEYATSCAAFANAHDGDTVLIDANHGVPYQEPPDPNHGGRSDCRIVNNDLKIRGVNGRPILDATGASRRRSGYSMATTC